MRKPVYLKINGAKKNVGEIDSDTMVFHKEVNQGSHFFKKHRAWAFDINVFEKIIKQHASFIELHDRGAKKLKYLYCNPNNLQKLIIDEYPPHGKQAFITMLDWKGSGHQLKLKEIKELFKEEAVGTHLHMEVKVPIQEELPL